MSKRRTNGTGRGAPVSERAEGVRGKRSATPQRPRKRSDIPPAYTKAALDRLYLDFEDRDGVADPVHLVRRYRDPADQEIAGFCAAALAFGRVASVLSSVEALLAEMTPSPHAFVRRFDPRRDGRPIRALGHRWIDGNDLVALLWVLRHMIDTAGSVEQFFLRGYRSDVEDISSALDDFCSRARDIPLSHVYASTTPRRGLPYFFPRPSDGSACKRLNLYLRWMVRRDQIDFGIWRHVDRAKLVVPLDTHVIRVGQCLRLTTYRSPGWPMARQITQSLRRFDPDDPVKYDFSICHLGMQNSCGFNQAQGDRDCPLRGVCRPRVDTRPRSRRPAGRR